LFSVPALQGLFRGPLQGRAQRARGARGASTRGVAARRPYPVWPRRACLVLQAAVPARVPGQPGRHQRQPGRVGWQPEQQAPGQLERRPLQPGCPERVGQPPEAQREPPPQPAPQAAFAQSGWPALPQVVAACPGYRCRACAGPFRANPQKSRPSTCAGWWQSSLRCCAPRGDRQRPRRAPRPLGAARPCRGFPTPASRIRSAAKARTGWRAIPSGAGARLQGGWTWWNALSA